MPASHYLVPVQMDGRRQDILQDLLADNTEAAEDFFVDAKERLLDVQNWTRYSAIADVTFNLTDSLGHAVMRRARKGDHIRMDIPEGGSGFGWVAIEAIEYDDYPDLNMETFAMRLRNCLNPIDHKGPGSANEPERGTTGTFVIERRGRNLISGYHDRNGYEYSGPDIDALPGIDMLNANATLGLTDAQCAALVKGFLF